MAVSPARTKWLKWAGVICTIIGVIDLPDQIQRWIKLIASWLGYIVNWDDAIFGNAGRWLFTVGGVVLLLIAYDVPSRLLAKLPSTFKQARKKESAPTESALPKLRLEFRESNTQFLRKEWHQEHLSQGWKYTGLIAVRNEAGKSIDQVRIAIGGIFPSRQGTRNFAVKRHAPDGIILNSIAPRDHQFVTLFELFDAPPFHNACILHVACEDENPGVGEEFRVKIRATGRDVGDPARIQIRFGFRNEQFFMENVNES